MTWLTPAMADAIRGFATCAALLAASAGLLLLHSRILRLETIVATQTQQLTQIEREMIRPQPDAPSIAPGALPPFTLDTPTAR
jgi:hypothetical protein